MWFLLILLVTKIIYAKDEHDCANIACEHDNVNVCGVHSRGSKEVSFRRFRDNCALQKFECETGIKGFTSVSMEFCNQALSLDTRKNSNSVQIITPKEGTQTEVLQVSPLNTNITFKQCIKCDCNVESKAICAIRAEGARFIIRWFADECHMLQYNCENNMNFTETNYDVCVGNEDDTSVKKTDMELLSAATKETEDMEAFETSKADFKNHSCVPHECVSNNRVVCAIRPEGERFIIRWFNDTCNMLQYNCEKHVDFSVIDDFICAGDKSLTEKYRTVGEILSVNDDVMEAETSTDLLEVTTTDLSNGTLYKLEKKNEVNSFPKNVVVSTFDMNENINQTVKNFFAASHTTGIRIQKLADEQTRRILVKDTGPVNIFVPRAFVPANYTPAENKVQNKTYPEYSPLVKYCYHKCPQKCPEFYRPVCGARIDSKKQTPFVFFKNHCYMDIAKCQMWWANYGGVNFTDLEEMGFIFCGGYKMMNMMYMFPLIRILQKMGRLQKKGKVHFVMRNLGQFPAPLQG